MGTLKTFFDSFRKRDGLSVFFSTFLIKCVGIVSSILIVRILTKEDFGNISFALSVIGILKAVEGLGSSHSLLRFGPQLTSYREKRLLYNFSLRKGLLYSLIIIILILICFPFLITDNLEGSLIYLAILTGSILTSFCLSISLSYFRIIGKNKAYSLINVFGSLITAFLVILLAYLFKGHGYAIALVLSPLITFFIFKKYLFNKEDFFNTNPSFTSLPTFSNRSFFVYGTHVGLGTIANQITIMAGPIIAGYMGALPSEIASFRVATIIPFNLLIIPSIILTTDFVHISKNSNNSQHIKAYYYQYTKTVFLLFTIPFAVLLYFNTEIITLLYGEAYAESANMSFILIVSVYFSFLFRAPLGNILAAVGKANWNVYHTIFWLLVLIPSSIIAFNKFHIIGIAYVISGILFFSGFISLILFYKYVDKKGSEML